MVESKSKKGKLDKTDLKKIGTGALVAMAGALLTFGTEVISQIELGQWTPVIVAFWSVIANAGRKWYKNNKTVYNTNLKMLFIVCLLPLVLGCAATNDKAVTVGTVDKDVNFRFVGSYNQEDSIAEIFKGAGAIPLAGGLGGSSPVNLILNRSGVEQTATMDFEKVGGSFNVTVIGTGNQNSGSQEIKTASDHINIGEFQPQIE